MNSNRFCNPNSMLIRSSARFQRQYTCILDERDASVHPFPLTWNVDILAHGRSQMLVIASEECSLFSILTPVSRVRDIDSFLTSFQNRLAEFFLNFNLQQPPDVTQAIFSNRRNRRVIGSQNDLLYITHELLKDVNQPPTPNLLHLIEKQLNSAPMSYLNMNCARDAFLMQVAKLKTT